MTAVSFLLGLNLLVYFVFGLLFFVLKMDVLGFKYTNTLQRGLPAIIAFWLLLESVGVALLLSIMRAAFTSETIILGKQNIGSVHIFFGKRDVQMYPIEEVNGFRLRHDPVGFSPSKLSIVVRGTPYLLAEGALESEREWINSIANLHLKKR